MLPTRVSNIAPSIPSLLLRSVARLAMPPASAVVRGCCRTTAAQTGIRFRFRRLTQLQPASFYAHQSPLSYKALFPPGGSGERTAVTLTRVAGYRRSPRGRQRRPIIRSNTHAPDQTTGRPRLIHWDFDLAAPGRYNLTSE